MENLKNVFILGDSYSTYQGYIPTDYPPYYSDELLGGVKNTWWQQVIDKTGSTLIENNSYSGSTICNTGYNGEDVSKTSSFVYRVTSLLCDGKIHGKDIDTFFIFGGTNDCWAESPIGEIKYSDWTKEDLKTVAGALCFIFDYLKNKFPNAKIINIVNKGFRIWDEFIKMSKTVCEHYNVVCVELPDVDKYCDHPTKKGMTEIAEKVLEKL